MLVLAKKLAPQKIFPKEIPVSKEGIGFYEKSDIHMSSSGVQIIEPARKEFPDTTESVWAVFDSDVFDQGEKYYRVWFLNGARYKICPTIHKGHGNHVVYLGNGNDYLISGQYTLAIFKLSGLRLKMVSWGSFMVTPG